MQPVPEYSTGIALQNRISCLSVGQCQQDYREEIPRLRESAGKPLLLPLRLRQIRAEFITLSSLSPSVHSKASLRVFVYVILMYSFVSPLPSPTNTTAVDVFVIYS